MGKDRSGLFEPGVREYAERLSHYVRFERVELAASRASEPARARAEEGAAILAKRGPREALVALDERGELLTSETFSALIGRAARDGRDLLFAVGGDEGLSDEVRKSAWKVVALSKMTLPHRLARLVIAEQLYRAFTLLRGEPYHK